MMLHQNFSKIKLRNCFSFVGANFPKNEIRNPARIPPQTPPAGGKSAEAKRKILSPRKLVFSLCRVRIEAQPPARRIEGRDPQKNVLFHLEEKIGRAQNQKSGEHFSVGHASGASGGWADSQKVTTGARERTRTSKGLLPLAPQASVFAISPPAHI